MDKLMSIIEHYEKSKLSQLEKCHRETFINMVKEFEFRDIVALSVGAGSGIWEYILLKKLSNIRKIIATDIVEGIIKESDQILLKSLVEWEFCKVEADSILPFRENMFDLVCR